jgi:uncharacterized protein YuzE
MRLEYDDEAGALYLAVGEIGPGGVARTVDEVPGELMIDLDAKGALLGVEILYPQHLDRVGPILERFGFQPPPWTRHADQLAATLFATA